MQSNWSRSSRAAFFLMLCTGCATAPTPVVLNPEEQLRQDVAVGSQVAENFEARVKLKKDTEVSVYLRKLANKLAQQVPALGRAPLGVLIVEDRENHWVNYSLPGNRIYLSSGWLRRTDFESEIAAAISLELAHLVRRDAVVRLTHRPEIASLEGPIIENIMPIPKAGQGQVSVDFFGPSGIFAFTGENRLAATEVAVDLLYRAGIDPRGLITFWEAHLSAKDHSPLDHSLLQRLIERTRQAIAQRAPLRNPVVRSSDFLAVKKRIERL